MGKIVTIGGGSMRELETLPIDKEIVELSGKSRPRALLIPTATYDSQEPLDIFQEVYGKRLGCDIDVLHLLNVTPTMKELQDTILSADLIYVSGGNTQKMMMRWRKLGVDRVLEAAFDKGIPLSGLSAGCICWYKHGHSNSGFFYSSDKWTGFTRVKGLGLIDAFACPNPQGVTDGMLREPDFHGKILRHGGMGLGIGYNCAIEWVDGEYRIITSDEGAGAYRAFRKRGELVREPIVQRKGFAPVAELLDR